jgi:hypothetical protein
MTSEDQDISGLEYCVQLKEIERDIRCMETVLQDNGDRLIASLYGHSHITTGTCGEDTTISRLHGDSLRRVVCPEE